MKKEKGFTLVELSIVLVIIGLLIGGILVAQSMISTVKIQGVIRQLQQYDVAITNFKTKYNQLPGDSSLFGTGGNNNGLISISPEGEHFWEHLSLGVDLKNQLNTNFIPFNFGVVNTLKDCPIFKVDQNSYGQPCLIARTTDFGFGDKHYYQYDESIGGLFVDTERRILRSSTSLAIDLKIDDGKGESGKLICSNGSFGIVYDLSNDIYRCEMILEVGATTVNTNS